MTDHTLFCSPFFRLSSHLFRRLSMRQILCFLLFLAFIFPASLSATVSQFQWTTPYSFQSGGDIGFTYTSTRDTVATVIYIEINDGVTLDTATDMLYFPLFQVDNDTASYFSDSLGKLPDGNDTLHRFLWYAEGVDLAPGLYWMRVLDGETAVADTFRILPPANPYRTISGNVTPPAGVSRSYIVVNADEDSSHSRFSAYTDDAGDYTIYIDSAAIFTGDTVFRVRVDKNYSSYLASPRQS